MRVFLLLTLVLVVVLLCSGAKDRRKKKIKGCQLNKRVYKVGKTAYKDRAHCLKLKCVKKKNKKGKVKYILQPKSYRNCECFAIFCRGKRCSPPEPCPRCSDAFEPVCGTNNITYTNECLLFSKTQPCGSVDAKLLFYGECGTCPIGCPKNIDPVCGSDGQTYSNECVLISSNCEANTAVTVAYEGSCDESDRITVNAEILGCGKCPKNRRPVCGSNGVTYSNLCLLEAAACAGEDVTFVHGGECVDDQSVRQPVAIKVKREKCKYNGKKYSPGEMIEDLVDYCLTVACQPTRKIGESEVVLQDFQGATACQCSSSPLRKKILDIASRP